LTSLPFWLLLDQLSFEEVVPVRLEMIERFLKVVDVSRLWELQSFDRFEENPLCVGETGGMFAPVASVEKAKASLLLSSRKR